MKKESSIRYILRLTLTLLLVTGLVAAVLSGVNALTRDRIARIQAKKTQAAIAQVLEGQAVPLTLGVNADPVTAVYQSEFGYAVQVGISGFDGTISMMVGIDLEGKVSGISIISHTETAGLGAVAGADTAAGHAFRDQFVGADSPLAVTKDGGSVDAITGATITSRAVTQGVNAALAYVKNLG